MHQLFVNIARTLKGLLRWNWQRARWLRLRPNKTGNYTESQKNRKRFPDPIPIDHAVSPRRLGG
jgi:hypothetical protein